jgi:hypothetical protein
LEPQLIDRLASRHAAATTLTSPLPLWERVARIEDARRERGAASDEFVFYR